MFNKDEFISFESIVKLMMELETINRLIDIDKLSKNADVLNSNLKEYIATNTLEGNKIGSSKAKQLLKATSFETEEEKSWIGIKYATKLTWGDSYKFGRDFINEIHRELSAEKPEPGGVYKIKINEAGTLHINNRDDVHRSMTEFIADYQLAKRETGISAIDVIQMMVEILEIEPYTNGTGTISRLLLNRELYDAGYKFVKYVSLSELIELHRKDFTKLINEYKEVNYNNRTPKQLLPLVRLLMHCLIASAQEALNIQSRIKFNEDTFKTNLPYILNSPLSLAQIMSFMKVANSKSSISKWLREMVTEGTIESEGQLKATKYKKA